MPIADNHKTYDICIIGAGVIGCAIARELSRYQVDVLLLEKEGDVATGVSRGNTSIIHGGFDDIHGSIKAGFSPQGHHMIQELNRYLHFGYRQIGALVVAFREEEEAELQRLRDNGQRNGVGGLEIWGKGRLREAEPELNPEAQAALYCAHSGVVIGPELCIALVENALANGLHLGLRHKVCGIERNAELLHIYCETQTEAGQQGRAEFRARYLVNAAAWGAAEISAMLGTLDYELKALKGQYLVFDRSCASLAKHILFPLPHPQKGKGVVATPTYHGNLLLGPSAEEAAEGDYSTNLEGLKAVFAKGQELLPKLPAAKVIRSFSGLRPQLPNKDFMIRHDASGMFTELIGMASPGISSSLPIAKAICQYLATIMPLLVKEDFVWERKAYLESQAERKFLPLSDLKAYTSKELSDPEAMICRCEQLSSAKIQQALGQIPWELSEARRNLDFLKWRTRVTMGFCQGAYCKPRLHQLLAALEGCETSEVLEQDEKYTEHYHKGLRPELQALRKALAEGVMPIENNN